MEFCEAKKYLRKEEFLGDGVKACPLGVNISCPYGNSLTVIYNEKRYQICKSQGELPKSAGLLRKMEKWKFQDYTT